MHFLPDIYVPCEVCKGKRYNRETLEVKYKGKNIYDVLEMTVEEALAFFENHPEDPPQAPDPATMWAWATSSWGRPPPRCPAARPSGSSWPPSCPSAPPARTIYILDEPTTGLHTADVHMLVRGAADRLVDAGNTVVVIEHNLDVIKAADHIIDLGPEGGDKGGEVLICGTPEEVAACDRSYTGKYLKKYL